MNRHALGLALCALVAWSLPVTAPAKIVCWKNHEGIRECGNAIPPEYAQQAAEIKSSQGITTRTRTRAKTPEELAAEQAEAERLAAIQEVEDRERREQEHKDKVLLATYTTEDDLVLARDSQLAVIDSRINHTEQRLNRLRERLQELRDEAAKLERGGTKAPEELVTEITGIEAQVTDAEGTIAKRHDEKDHINERFQMDLARYRELKGR